jgi:hypothetical protein
MSKEVIENYLRAHSSNFSIDDLKNKLIAGGYSKKDVDEIGDKISNEGGAVPALPKKAGFRWLRWSGIFMFIFLGIWALNFVLGFFAGSIPAAINSVLGIIILIVMVIGVVILVTGWLRLAKLTNSRLMRFGLFGMLYTGLLVLVLSVGSFVLLWFNPSLIFTLGAFNFVFFGLFILAGLFIYVCSILVQVALIKLRKRIRFTGLVGVLSLVAIFIEIIIIILQRIYLQSIFSSILPSGSLAGGVGSVARTFPSIYWVILSLAVIVTIIGFIGSILAGLMFFDASRKFEIKKE